MITKRIRRPRAMMNGHTELSNLPFGRIKRNINRCLRSYKKAKTHTKKDWFKNELILWRVAYHQKRANII